MRKQEFKTWLKSIYISTTGSPLNQSTCRSRIANCQNAEKFEGDLDDHFRADQFTSLLQRLTYSQNDLQRGLATKHNVPIDGILYTGTATLRNAIRLYLQFSIDWPMGTPPPQHKHLAQTPGQAGKTATRRSATRKSPWPEWETPNNIIVLELARITTKYFRFLHPDIVQAVVEDNELHTMDWSARLAEHQVDPEAYLWPKSACAFPGIRRYAGSREIAEFRGHRNEKTEKPADAIRLDDNDFPKQIWSFVFRGKKFPKHGPIGYSLAHLADHKQYKNRFEEDFRFERTGNEPTKPLFGLYTSAANGVYVPSNLIKPTDFAGSFRNLLMRKAESLYGIFCNLLPPWLSIPVDSNAAEWSLNEFDWSEPVGTKTDLPQFLEFRRDVIERMLETSK